MGQVQGPALHEQTEQVVRKVRVECPQIYDIWACTEPERSRTSQQDTVMAPARSSGRRSEDRTKPLHASKLRQQLQDRPDPNERWQKAKEEWEAQVMREMERQEKAREAAAGTEQEAARPLSQEDERLQALALIRAEVEQAAATETAETKERAAAEKADSKGDPDAAAADAAEPTASGACAAEEKEAKEEVEPGDASPKTCPEATPVQQPEPPAQGESAKASERLSQPGGDTATDDADADAFAGAKEAAPADAEAQKNAGGAECNLVSA
eukprot:TRINITY_DN12346_c0_g1_i1.p1 TRINITY_DN12346_c0_g1~~TRINITY_DN12346_c0_g1_i1.p1  ORF type:complete len:269 (-),score=89.52 TRINITY_DN12346_c0_g1_i1:132-938(-)